jgi:hypothetical protein
MRQKLLSLIKMSTSSSSSMSSPIASPTHDVHRGWVEVEETSGASFHRRHAMLDSTAQTPTLLFHQDEV